MQVGWVKESCRHVTASLVKPCHHEESALVPLKEVNHLLICPLGCALSKIGSAHMHTIYKRRKEAHNGQMNGVEPLHHIGGYIGSSAGFTCIVQGSPEVNILRVDIDPLFKQLFSRINMPLRNSKVKRIQPQNLEVGKIRQGTSQNGYSPSKPPLCATCQWRAQALQIQASLCPLMHVWEEQTFVEFGSVPILIREMHVFVAPDDAARCSGRFPTLFAMFGFAPKEASLSSIWMCPSAAAIDIGVFPFLSRAFRSAPILARVATTFPLPFEAAKWMAFHPRSSLATEHRAPRLARLRMAVSSPASAALHISTSTSDGTLPSVAPCSLASFPTSLCPDNPPPRSVKNPCLPPYDSTSDIKDTLTAS